jgi:hypothetical protein
LSLQGLSVPPTDPEQSSSTFFESERNGALDAVSGEFDFSGTWRPQDERREQRRHHSKPPASPSSGSRHADGSSSSTSTPSRDRTVSPSKLTKLSSSGTRRESMIEREFNHLLAHFAPKSGRALHASTPDEELRHPKQGREIKEKLCVL